MSKLLTMAACLDPIRAAHLAANDAAMLQPLKGYRIEIKRWNTVRLSFECMAPSRLVAALRHEELAGDGEYVMVHDLRPQPVSSCVECVVCGGRSAPASTGLCTACRSLKATFASRYPDEVPA